jgi:hypothetical protein
MNLLSQYSTLRTTPRDNIDIYLQDSGAGLNKSLPDRNRTGYWQI